MRYTAFAIGIVLLGALSPILPAHAGCTWTWDCSGGAGNCRQIPLCDGSLDIPPPRPPSVPPIAPPSVRPVPVPTVPPVGTSRCRQAYICDAYGHCNWQTVCN